MKPVTTMTDRVKAFLNQFENPSKCPDLRSFELDDSNQYYNLLYSVAKELQPNLVVELAPAPEGVLLTSQLAHLAMSSPSTSKSVPTPESASLRSIKTTPCQTTSQIVVWDKS